MRKLKGRHTWRWLIAFDASNRMTTILWSFRNNFGTCRSFICIPSRSHVKLDPSSCTAQRCKWRMLTEQLPYRKRTLEWAGIMMRNLDGEQANLYRTQATEHTLWNHRAVLSNHGGITSVRPFANDCNKRNSLHSPPFGLFRYVWLQLKVAQFPRNCALDRFSEISIFTASLGYSCTMQTYSLLFSMCP